MDITSIITDRIHSWDLFELFVIAINGEAIVVGNVSDISDTGLSIQIDSGNYQNFEDGSPIRCVISGSSMKEIKFAGKIIRTETVATSFGVKGFMAIEFSNPALASEQLKALISAYSK
ncbi:type IV pilus assembly protein PilZ [Leptospira broomii serovar Hurstbridge str. 5399]|uniref:Type IV pilus assembly protein PilZ n=1 Tax=Leptospira broomii serovar Hurstbridge str. 5399 TaxID=1049789 RepID=T0F6X9_9LEPT|nr:PilZ domain-containing protein [Leptospira broomii]EQA43651.1 type IV pilus assembly protein PilZ [Leptospira broomii serovar Hurstbridge str. 5399]